MTCKGPFQYKLFYESMILWFYDSVSQNYLADCLVTRIN